MQFYKKGAAVIGALTVLAGIVAVSINATTGTFTNLAATNATTTNLVVTGSASLPGTLTATVPTFTTGNLLATSTFSAQVANVTSTLAVGGVSSLAGITFTQATGTTSFAIPAAGSPLKGLYRTTASINVDSMAAAQSTSSAVTLTGAAVGDHCGVDVTLGDYWSTTSTGWVRCKITATNTATLYFSNVSGTAAFDAGTSSFSILDFAF